MYRRATEPYDAEAIQTADDEFYRLHPELVQNGQRIPLDPNDPSQAALREEWMDLYVKAGGQVEVIGGPVKKKPEDPVEPCPLCGKGNLAIQVLDDAGLPIAGALVEVEGLGVMLTDENGWADFGAVEPGTYQIAASKEGYDAEPGVNLVEVIEDSSNTGTLVLEKSPEPTNPETKYVYLTFDDGPEAGTKEVYDLLKRKGIRGTFFCVGESATYYEKNVEAGFLQKLARDMEVANHSQTHAHQYYSSFYDTGLMLNPVTLEPDATAGGDVRRSVLMDFEYASISFDEVLSKRAIPRPNDPRYDFRGTLDLSKLDYRRRLKSRMPGSNIWRLNDVKTQGWNLRARLDEADELFRNGYRIYGWDYEFEMTFEIKEEQRKEYEAGREAHLDLYAAAYIDMDRPTMTGAGVFATLKAELEASAYHSAQKPNKVILLMHDRAFRRYKAGQENKYLNELEELIDLCLKEGYKFDVTSNY